MNEGAVPKENSWRKNQKNAEISLTKAKVLFRQKTAPSQEEVGVLKDFIKKSIAEGQRVEIQYYVYNDEKWVQRTARGKVESLGNNTTIMMKECTTFNPEGKPDGEPGYRILSIGNPEEFIISAQNS